MVGGFVWVRLFEFVRTRSGCFSFFLFSVVLGGFGCNLLFQVEQGCFGVPWLLRGCISDFRFVLGCF